MIAIIKYIVAIGKYLFVDGLRARRDQSPSTVHGVVFDICVGDARQATTMIRLRNWVRAERPSWRSSRVSERRESGR